MPRTQTLLVVLLAALAAASVAVRAAPGGGSSSTSGSSTQEKAAAPRWIGEGQADAEAAAATGPDAAEEEGTEQWAYRLVSRVVLPMKPMELFGRGFWGRRPAYFKHRNEAYLSPVLGLHDLDRIVQTARSTAPGQEAQLMRLGAEWKIVKRTRGDDGEFWTKGFADPSAVPEGFANDAESRLNLTRASLFDGYSIIINNMQNRWYPVFRLAQAFESLMGWHVNVNMYVTPPLAQGFESHIDWMDGIILQLHGWKHWHVFQELVHQPRPDQKYKPAQRELWHPGKGTVQLLQGDAFYMPRGFIHEARTMAASSGAEDDMTVSVQDRINALQAAEEEAAQASEGSSDNQDNKESFKMPSVHLTVGLESASDSTWEILIHHAIQTMPSNAGGREGGLDVPLTVMGTVSGSDDAGSTGANPGPVQPLWSNVTLRSMMHVGMAFAAELFPQFRTAIPRTSFGRAAHFGLSEDQQRRVESSQWELEELIRNELADMLQGFTAPPLAQVVAYFAAKGTHQGEYRIASEFTPLKDVGNAFLSRLHYLKLTDIVTEPSVLGRLSTDVMDCTKERFAFEHVEDEKEGAVDEETDAERGPRVWRIPAGLCRRIAVKEEHDGVFRESFGDSFSEHFDQAFSAIWKQFNDVVDGRLANRRAQAERLLRLQHMWPDTDGTLSQQRRSAVPSTMQQQKAEAAISQLFEDAKEADNNARVEL